MEYVNSPEHVVDVSLAVAVDAHRRTVLYLLLTYSSC